MRSWVRVALLLSAVLASVWLGCSRFLGAGRDDMFLTLWSGLQLARGEGLINHDGVPLEVSSSLLHTWVVALLALVDAESLVLSNKLVGLAALLGTLVLLAGPGRSLLGRGAESVPALALVLAITATTPSLVYWSLGGLETGLAVLLWTALPLALARASEDASRWRSLAGIGSLFVLTRPEGLLVLLLAATLFVALRDRGPSPALKRGALAWLLTFAAVSAWRLTTFDSLWPNPVLAKADPTLDDVLRGAHYVVGLYTSSWLMAALGAVLLVTLGRAVRGRVGGDVTLAVLSAVVAQHAFVVATGGDWMEHHRFLQPIVPLLAILLARGLGDRLSGPVGAPRLVLCAALLGLLLQNQEQASTVRSGKWAMDSTALTAHGPAPEARGLTERTLAANTVWRRDAKDLFPYLEENLAGLAERAGEPLVLATPQMGQLPWFLRQRLSEIPVELVDTRGLCDPDLARLDAARGPFGLAAGADLAGIVAGDRGVLSEAVRARRPNLLYRVRETEEGIARLGTLGFELVHRGPGSMVFLREGPWRELGAEE